jgi:hypothetical protein
MPFPRINALRTLGATLAAAVVVIPMLAHADGPPGKYPAFIQDCYDHGMSLSECKRAFVAKGDCGPDGWQSSKACVFERVFVFDLAIQKAEHAQQPTPDISADEADKAESRSHVRQPRETPLCAGRMTRDGCQR